MLGGGEAEAITERVKQTYEPGRPAGRGPAGRGERPGRPGPPARPPADLEVAVLDRGNGRRAFRRLTGRGGDAAIGGDRAMPARRPGGAEAAERGRGADAPAPADETATPTPEAPDAGSGDAGG